jgi:hypothetical protein
MRHTGFDLVKAELDADFASAARDAGKRCP